MGIEAVYEIEAAQALIADLVAERDALRAALARAEQTLRNLAHGFLDAEANVIAHNEAANIRAALAKAEGESCT